MLADVVCWVTWAVGLACLALCLESCGGAEQRPTVVCSAVRAARAAAELAEPYVCDVDAGR